MLYMISGKIGGGKTLFALQHVIIEELINGSRTVVTNVELDVAAINEWIQKNRPKAPVIDINRRIRILDESQTLQFYLHRGYDNDGKPIDFPPVTKEEERIGQYPPLHSLRDATGRVGVLYVLDEIHTFFNARNWANFGLSCSWYIAQHRKLNDMIYAIAQFPDQVDKQLRSYAQSWISIENEGRVMIKGFRGRAGHFAARWYAEQPPLGFTKRLQAEQTLTWKIDTALAKCYDTSQGIGIKGTKKPEVVKLKGLPPWVIIFVAVGVIVVACAIPKAIGMITTGFLTQMQPDQVRDLSKGSLGIPSAKSTSPSQKRVDDAPESLYQPDYRYMLVFTMDGFTDLAYYDANMVDKADFFNSRQSAIRRATFDSSSVVMNRQRVLSVHTPNGTMVMTPAPVGQNDSSARPPVVFSR